MIFQSVTLGPAPASSTRELARNANSQASLQMHSFWGGAQKSLLALHLILRLTEGEELLC